VLLLLLLIYDYPGRATYGIHLVSFAVRGQKLFWPCDDSILSPLSLTTFLQTGFVKPENGIIISTFKLLHIETTFIYTSLYKQVCLFCFAFIIDFSKLNGRREFGYVSHLELTEDLEKNRKDLET